MNSLSCQIPLGEFEQIVFSIWWKYSGYRYRGLASVKVSSNVLEMLDLAFLTISDVTVGHKSAVQHLAALFSVVFMVPLRKRFESNETQRSCFRSVVALHKQDREGQWRCCFLFLLRCIHRVIQVVVTERFASLDLLTVAYCSDETKTADASATLCLYYWEFFLRCFLSIVDIVMCQRGPPHFIIPFQDWCLFYLWGCYHYY